MEAPRCFICGHRHWSTQAHIEPFACEGLNRPVPRPRDAITVMRGPVSRAKEFVRNAMTKIEPRNETPPTELRNAQPKSNEAQPTDVRYAQTNAERQARYRRRRAHMRHR
jgi:hypothetical protein